MEEFFGETLRVSKVAVSVVNGSISCLVVPGFRSIRPHLAVNTSQGDVKHTVHKNRILILRTEVATSSSVPEQSVDFFVDELKGSLNTPNSGQIKIGRASCRERVSITEGGVCRERKRHE